LAGLVEIPPAALDADLLGHGDFHVGNVVLVPLGFEQAVGETQRDQVLDGFFAQVVVDAVGAVFREELRHGVIDLARGLQIRTDGFFQDYAGVFRQADLGQVLADRAVHRRGGGEIGDQPLADAGLFSQGHVVFGFHEVDVDVSQAREEALGDAFVQLLADVLAHRFFDMDQVLLLGTGLTGQGQDARIFVQEPGAIELIEGRKQLAQRQITQGAKQGKGAGFYGYRRHDVCSFIKLSYKYLFSRHHSRENVVITTTFSRNTHCEWWCSATLSRIGHRKRPLVDWLPPFICIVARRKD